MSRPGDLGAGRPAAEATAKADRRPYASPMLHHHASGMTEADAIRYASATAAFFGALIASPDGVRLLWRAGREQARRGQSWIREWLRDFVSLFRLPTLHRRAEDRGAATERQKVTRRFEWNTGADPIDELRKNVDYLLAEMFRHRKELMDRISAAEASARRAIAERDAAHKAAHEEAEQRAARVDARAVVLVAGAVLLSTFPDALAHFALLGWIVLGLVVIVTLGLAGSAWNDARKSVAPAAVLNEPRLPEEAHEGTPGGA
jgi:hypothetical protein